PSAAAVRSKDQRQCCRSAAAVRMGPALRLPAAGSRAGPCPCTPHLAAPKGRARWRCGWQPRRGALDVLQLRRFCPAAVAPRPEGTVSTTVPVVPVVPGGPAQPLEPTVPVVPGGPVQPLEPTVPTSTAEPAYPTSPCRIPNSPRTPPARCSALYPDTC